MGVVPYYWCPEQLQFADQVEFKISRRCYDDLEYATDIKLIVRGNETRFKVVVIAY